MFDRGLLMGVILRSPPLTRDEESLRWADGETLRTIPEMAALRVTLLSFAPGAGTGRLPDDKAKASSS